MRHLLGVVLAIVLAAAVFFAASWGYLKLLIGPARLNALPAGGGSLLRDHAVLEGFGVLLLVGLVTGILIAGPRISPLASGLPGLVLLAWTALYLVSVRRAVQYIPLRNRAYGTGFEAMLFDGVLALAGLAMISPLFVPSRWRRAGPRTAYSGATAYAGTAGPPSATGYPGLQSTQTIAPDSGLLADWSQTQTRPQRPVDPNDPGRSQAPWGPADYS
jgi:hypothetical protein